MGKFRTKIYPMVCVSQSQPEGSYIGSEHGRMSKSIIYYMFVIKATDGKFFLFCFLLFLGGEGGGGYSSVHLHRFQITKKRNIGGGNNSDGRTSKRARLTPLEETQYLTNYCLEASQNYSPTFPFLYLNCTDQSVVFSTGPAGRD